MSTIYARQSRTKGGSGAGARWLAACGVIGPVLFVIAFTVAGLVRPGYSPVHQAVSDLGVGSNPWLLNAPLVGLGLLLAAFVVGFFQIPGGQLGRWRWACAVLLLLPGFGFAWAGIFTEAPATVSLHWMVGMPALAAGSIFGFLVTGLRLRVVPGWRPWAIYSMAAAAITAVIIAVMFGTWSAGVGGIIERVLFVEVLAWYAAFGGRLFLLGEQQTR